MIFRGAIYLVNRGANSLSFSNQVTRQKENIFGKIFVMFLQVIT